jgi:hypothetical protein
MRSQCERRERADQAGKLHDCSPDCGGHVHPRDSRPPGRQQATEHDEHDEREVQHDDDVGEQAIGHVFVRAQGDQTSIRTTAVCAQADSGKRYSLRTWSAFITTV